MRIEERSIVPRRLDPGLRSSWARLLLIGVIFGARKDFLPIDSRCVSSKKVRPYVNVMQDQALQDDRSVSKEQRYR